jgi:hypothetical protein
MSFRGAGDRAGLARPGIATGPVPAPHWRYRCPPVRTKGPLTGTVRWLARRAASSGRPRNVSCLRNVPAYTARRLVHRRPLPPARQAYRRNPGATGPGPRSPALIAPSFRAEGVQRRLMFGHHPLSSGHILTPCHTTPTFRGAGGRHNRRLGERCANQWPWQWMPIMACDLFIHDTSWKGRGFPALCIRAAAQGALSQTERTGDVSGVIPAYRADSPS